MRQNRNAQLEQTEYLIEKFDGTFLQRLATCDTKLWKFHKNVMNMTEPHTTKTFMIFINSMYEVEFSLYVHDCQTETHTDDVLTERMTNTLR